MAEFHFELLSRHAHSAARRGRLHTPHGAIDTPCFMPVGTRATVKAIDQEGLEALGAEIILGNTYHLFLRPGHELIRALGGLHRFMSWPHPILTDSGGFQVFSLSSLNKIEESGVTFRSHIDGAQHQLTPELSIAVQRALGADIIMAFDDCTPYPATEPQARASLERTLRWAERSRAAWQGGEEARRSAGLGLGGPQPGASTSGRRGGASVSAERALGPAPVNALFGIVQGGMYAELRSEAAERLAEMDLPGYAIGGVSVGEPRELSREAVRAAIAALPADKPRYLMGVGTPAELIDYASMGIDMMDCVLPTRNARNGLLFTSAGALNVKNARFARDPAPPDAACGCPTCRRYSRAYLRHLFLSGEILASQLNTQHNLWHYLDTMRQLRHAIELGQPLPGTLS